MPLRYPGPVSMVPISLYMERSPEPKRICCSGARSRMLESPASARSCAEGSATRSLFISKQCASASRKDFVVRKSRVIFRNQVPGRLEIFLVQQILEAATINSLLLRIALDPNVVLLYGYVLAESLCIGKLKDPLK